MVSSFQSIPDTIYFAFVAMGTIGFGDVYPRTYLGRALIIGFIFIGIFLFSFPSIVLSISFNRELNILKEKRKNTSKLELLKLTSKGRGK